MASARTFLPTRSEESAAETTTMATPTLRNHSHFHRHRRPRCRCCLMTKFSLSLLRVSDPRRDAWLPQRGDSCADRQMDALSCRRRGRQDSAAFPRPFPRAQQQFRTVRYRLLDRGQGGTALHSTSIVSSSMPLVGALCEHWQAWGLQTFVQSCICSFEVRVIQHHLPKVCRVVGHFATAFLQMGYLCQLRGLRSLVGWGQT